LKELSLQVARPMFSYRGERTGYPHELVGPKDPNAWNDGIATAFDIQIAVMTSV
jgi:hypothetical protein